MPDLHTWEMLIIDINEYPLAVFTVHPAPQMNTKQHVFFNVEPGRFIAAGTAGFLLVTKDGVVYAKQPYGQFRVVVDPNHKLLGGLTSVPTEYLVVTTVAAVPKKCTCGGWAVYGKEADIHSDDRVNICDLRKK